MSANEEVKEPLKQEVTEHIEPVNQEKVVVEVMVREEVVTSCCSTKKEEVHIAGKCCAYTWCISLNSIECVCVSMSKVCILLSDAALCCNKFLEQIDCDTH